MKHKWFIASILFGLELFLCAGIVVASSSSLAQFRQSGVQLRFFKFDTISAEASEEQNFTVAAPASLVVTNLNGAVVVQPGAENAIVVRMHKKAWGNSQSDAQAALATLKPEISQSGNTVTVNYPAPPDEFVIFGSRHLASVDLTISVPTSTAVSVQNAFGSITLSGTSGDIQLQARNGPIHASNISGNVNLHSSFGNLIAEHVDANTFTASSNNGAISLTNVNATGALTLTNSFGSILWNGGRAASLNAKTNNGAVTLANVTVQGAVIGSDSFGSMALNQVQAAFYNLHTANGKITVDGASGTLQATSSVGDVQVTHGSNVNLDLHSSNGSITYSGSLGSGPHSLTTSFGSVRLNLPQDSALTLDLKTNFGQLQSAFPITMNGATSNKHWTGTINGGGAQLTAGSDNGSISLNVLNP
jgi:DUF4097 and DUF4098 domain-containing protein YvlB